MKIKSCLLILLALVTASCFAAEPYVIGMFGSAKVDVEQSNNDAALIAAGATNLSSSVTDSAGLVKIGVGFTLTPRIAVELAYVHSGDYAYHATFTGGTADVTFSASGFGASLLGFAPLTETASLYGRLGLYNFDVDAKATVKAAGVASASRSGNSISPEVGFGIEFALSPTSAIRAEYDFYSSIGDSSTGKSDVNVLSVGFLFRF